MIKLCFTPVPKQHGIIPSERTVRYMNIKSILAILILLSATALAQNDRPRARDIGIEPGIFPTGQHNAITDVAGVKVGHKTIIKGKNIRTGVTAILPHGGNIFQEKVPAAVYVGNGFGKAAGFLQVRELGNIETPIVLTNTLDVGTGISAVVDWTLNRPGNENVRSVNAIVGETNDGYLNDIRGKHVQAKDVLVAIESAGTGPVAEGSVGAGTGTMALGWKGGIGTSSRKIPANLGGYTVGALVQSNFGGILTIDGMQVGEKLGRYHFRRDVEQLSEATPNDEHHEYGSCMIIIATDAPLSARNLERIAKRAVLGLARVGGYMSNGSGDFVVVFSTANRIPYDTNDRSATNEILRNDHMSPLFLATVESVEEAVINSLLKATSVTGNDGHHMDAIDIEALKRLLEE
jgi:D-aminopeptidase